ncbi:MAG: glycine dehydrogenase (aminomethyl-transferring), partial [Deltaproteobacteria bacterium]|nr:glycine dehydrogenase (aminomethyl-transferring) [Deltaproteobacteria bacterium]
MPVSAHPDRFVDRHLGPDATDVDQMLHTLGFASLDALIAAPVPASIRLNRALDLPAARSEFELLADLRGIAGKNQVWKSYLGQGYHDCITPPVIQRNVLENPGWYTQYTPYQPEIAQGRLEALLNFQTMVIDLTGLPVANASLLDEGTAAAEAMNLSHAVRVGERAKVETFFIASDCHPQTIEVVRTRAKPLGITVLVGDPRTFDFSTPIFGALLQYPGTDGAVHDPRAFIEKAHAQGALVTMAADLLSLALLTPPGELGADIAVGSAQRFGVPMGYGGPHAAFFATSQAHVRHLPGRIIGVSVDSRGKPALRMALQTREQHIRREKATSNICTAQALLAIMASSYAVFHGPKGLRGIAQRVHELTGLLAAGVRKHGLGTVTNAAFFDTLCIEFAGEVARTVVERAAQRKINLRQLDAKAIAVALDETTTVADVNEILEAIAAGLGASVTPGVSGAPPLPGIPAALTRTSAYLTHPVFNTHHSETEMLRYLRSLADKDLALDR